jgi:hypothetical protein
MRMKMAARGAHAWWMRRWVGSWGLSDKNLRVLKMDKYICVDVWVGV